MKTYLVVVWLMSSGQLTGEPWREWPTMAACQAEENRVRDVARDDRILFAGGCLDAESAKKFTAMRFTLTPADPR